MELCKYKDIFDKPGCGVHRHRLFNIAIVDVVMTLVMGCIISYTFSYSLLIVTIILFIMGIVLHRMFCVRTTIDKILFSN